MFTQVDGDGDEDLDLYSFVSMMSGVLGIMTKNRVAALSCALFFIMGVASSNVMMPGFGGRTTRGANQLHHMKQLLANAGVVAFCFFSVYVEYNI